MKKPRIKKEILLALVIAGLVGIILFYPVKMESGKTCLFQRIVDNEIDPFPHSVSDMAQNQLILKRYLLPFGFVWWFSIFLFVSSVYYFINSKYRS